MKIGGNSTKNDGSQKVTGLGYSTSRTIKIVATDTEGQSRSWSKTEKTNPKPARSVKLSEGPMYNGYSNSTCPPNCNRYSRRCAPGAAKWPRATACRPT